jgi:quinoprotein glucose dehydrogenase
MFAALDAATGRAIWRHHTEGTANEHGYAYWTSKDNSARRILFSANNTAGDNAATTALVKSFGNGGPVDLREGLCRNPLWPVWERPIPTTTNVHSEEAWPTQPFPTVLYSISR